MGVTKVAMQFVIMIGFFVLCCDEDGIWLSTSQRRATTTVQASKPSHRLLVQVNILKREPRQSRPNDNSPGRSPEESRD